jgi:DNA polymerase-3 subunit delta
MALRPEQLARDLERGLRGVYLVSGDETLLVQEACDQIIAAARSAGFTERELIQVETGFNWFQLTEAANAMSLFASRRLLDVRVPAKRFDKDAADVLLEYLDKPSPDTLLLLRTERLDSKQRAAAWFKRIDKVGATLLVWPIDAKEMPAWIARRSRRVGLELSRDALVHLASSTEGNLLAAVQEIEKLALAGLPQPVTLAALTAAVGDTAHYDTFDLIDAALAREATRVRHIVCVLRAEGIGPLTVLGAFTWRLRQLVGGDRGGVQQRDLETMLVRCAWIDQQVKGAAVGDPWQSIERMALHIAGVGDVDWLDQRIANFDSSGVR